MTRASAHPGAVAESRVSRATRRTGVALGAVAAFGAACFAYGVIVERHRFCVRRFSLPVLPPGSPSLRVLHISDMHLLARQRLKRAFLRELRGLEPDLVVNTGDNVSAAAAIEPLLADLGRLLDVPGVFVFGSNDYTGPRLRNPFGYLLGDTRDQKPRGVPLPVDDLRARFVAAGWHDLNNARGALTLQGVRLDLRGTDDAHISRDRYPASGGSSAPGPSAADPANAEGAHLTLGVTHSPYLRVLDAFVADGVQLILAGHTHGGQVCVPGYGALITNCDLDLARVKGVSQHSAGTRTAVLHVSAGIGGSPFAPFRFACRPEASLLTLVARDSGL